MAAKTPVKATFTGSDVTGLAEFQTADFIAVADGGTGYTTASGVATTGGAGTGLTVDITDTAGVVTGALINAAGSDYKVGDVVTITGGNGDATVTVTTLA